MSMPPMQTWFDPFHASGKSGSDASKGFSSLLKMDLLETDKEFQIVSDIPGVDPNEIDLSLQERSIYITVFRDEEYGDRANRVHLQERPYGSVNRRVDLPKNAEVGEAKSVYKNGVLTVIFPKLQTTSTPQSHKKLTISQA